MSAAVPRVVRWRRAVLASRLAHRQVRVAMALAEHMNGDGGSCWPSVDLLALESSTDRRGVQRALRELEGAGWIERCNAGRGGRGRATEYRASFPDSPERAAGAPRFSDEKQRPDVLKRAASGAQKGGVTTAPGLQEVDREDVPPVVPPAGGRASESRSRSEDRLAALDIPRFQPEELEEVEP